MPEPLISTKLIAEVAKFQEWDLEVAEEAIQTIQNLFFLESPEKAAAYLLREKIGVQKPRPRY